MINISKEKLDRVVEGDNTDRMIGRLVNALAKAFIPLVIAEFIIAFLLTAKINIIISLLIFAALDAALPLVVCFSALFINSAVKIIRISGGVIPAVKNQGTIRRTKKYYNLFMDEICSDNTLAEALELAQSSGGEGYGYISALSHVVCCHSMRCEFDAASEALDKLKKLPQKDLIFRNDYMVTVIDYATITHDDKLFLDTVAEYSDVINTLTDRDAGAVTVLLVIASYEQKLHGNYETALQYLCWCQEYREKMRRQGKFTNQPPLRNYRKYANAAVCLEKADIYLHMGDTEKAHEELAAANEALMTVTCDIPPIFIKERDEIVSRLTNPEI